ncbi:hypothetical protein M427DRAFT_110488 [Gonapodya prolifera JEL478]|uniref:Dolichyl-diphosphooligosaccharide--protein glycosyltransferase subunit 1 n=1 Tax=Gonapodya prolifera (strain JEL478) TaxID=1344416 RepID=A0A139AKR1_GONPJ|nr:hypothetical protein M427DRAFT_110488 [Gonapodya prolifera JEL478]|eukprot:KXS17382.1 hypothetical protein M427DRAFT_110488 [Gonapodya prolifera JEL478]
MATMRRFRLPHILLICIAAFFYAAALFGNAASKPADRKSSFMVPSTFTNTKVERILDISHPAIARETVTLDVENTGKSATGEYFVAVDVDLECRKLAWLEAYEGKGASRKDWIVEKGALDASNSVQLYKVTFPKPLSPFSHQSFTLYFVWVGLVSNLPKKVAQGEQGSGVYQGALHWVSPYPTTEEKLGVRPSSSEIHSRTPSGSLTSTGLSYGPFRDVAPFSRETLRVHAKLSHVPLRGSILKRKITISHWTGIANVLESWELWHDGAELVQPFSRTDLLIQGRYATPPTMIQHLRFDLPAGAFNGEYRDFDGNVSTSHFSSGRSGATLELRPRYPMFGGWKYQFWFAYDVPLSKSVGIGKDGRYVWKGPVMRGLQNVPVDRLEVEVVLPEGSNSAQIKLPFSADEKTSGREYSYFDTIGRETVGFVKTRVVDEMWKDFEVSYNFPSTAYFRKPFVAIVAVLAAFLGSMAVLRLEFSIGKDSKGEAAEMVRTVGMRVHDIHGKLESLLAKLNVAFEDFKHSHHDVARFEAARADLTAQIQSTLVDLSSVTKSVSGLSGDDSARLEKSAAQLANLWIERLSKVRQAQDEVVALRKKVSASSVDDKTRRQVGERIKKLEVEEEVVAKKAETLVAGV